MPMSKFDFADSALSQLNPDNHQNLIRIFEETVAEYAERPAFTALGQPMSFAELETHSRAFAGWLLNDCKLEEGDRVAVQLPNLLQYPIAAWGILRAGLILVNTNPLYTARELEHQFTDSGAKALVVLQEFIPTVEQIVANTGVKTIISTNVFDMMEAQPLPETGLGDAIRLVAFPDTIAAGENFELPAITSSMSDVAVLQYTGGTTGPAKGAMLSHGNIFAYTQQSKVINEQNSSYDPETVDMLVAPLPLYHVFGLTLYLMGNFIRGGHAVLIPNPRDIDSMMETMIGLTPTGFAAVNTMLVAMLQHPKFEELDWSACEGTIAGGAALVPEVAKEWERRSNSRVYEGYGLSETTALLTVNTEMHNRLGTVGKPVFGQEVKLITAEGAVAKPGEEGELWVRGANVMRGYWGRPEATNEAIDDDGFFKTGDVAIEEEGGFYRIVDRLKDMVLVSGFNVYPNEIENIAYEHPAIIEAAVIGKPDEKTGERVCLFAVSSDPNLTAEEVKEFCAERLAGYKRPKEVTFMDDLPKSNVGKILRRELRE